MWRLYTSRPDGTAGDREEPEFKYLPILLLPTQGKTGAYTNYEMQN